MKNGTDTTLKMIKQGQLAIIRATAVANPGDLFVTQGIVFQKNGFGSWVSLQSMIKYESYELGRVYAIKVWTIL